MSASNRVRRVLASRGELIALLLVVVAVGAFAGAAMVYTDPPTEVVTDQRNPQRFSVDTNTSAVVQGETPLYDAGEELVNKPVYFLSASPEVSFAVATTVPADRSVEVVQRLTLHTQANLNGEPYYEETVPLAADDRTVTDGRVVTETTVNVTDLRERVSVRRSATGDVGGFHSELHLDVFYRSEGYSGNLTARALVVFRSGAFWLDADLSAARTESETVTREVEGEPDPAAWGGLSLLGLLALVGAVGIGLARARGDDLESVETDIAHQRYQEWISQGQFPTGTEKKYVKIETLEDLVDIAIDSNKRVVFDPEFDAYGVVDGDIIYYFSTDPLRIDSWLDV